MLTQKLHRLGRTTEDDHPAVGFRPLVRDCLHTPRPRLPKVQCLGDQGVAELHLLDRQQFDGVSVVG